MKSSISGKELEIRAAEALRALLRQVSAIKLKDMKVDDAATGRVFDILASVGVFGENHTLACKVTSSGEPHLVRQALQELLDGAAHLASGATPVFIAPYLPPEARALCTENKTGFLDLEDNARLMVGEVFIGKRSMGPRQAQRRTHVRPQEATARVVSKLPVTRSALPPSVAASCAA